MSTILTDDDIRALISAHGSNAAPTESNGYTTGDYPLARAVIAAYEAKLAQQVPVAEIPPELDVRRILLSVVPGDDGMGHEICATNVADVEKKLGELWGELEEWQLGIRRLPAPQQADRQRVPDGWVDAVQKIADENEVEPSFVTMVFEELLPVFMADKDAAGYVTLPLDSLIENDSYGVYGSDFYRCKVCGAESGAGVLNKGIPHSQNCPLAAAPEAPAVARDKLKVLADEYAAQCSEFARKLASGKPDDSMSPIAVAAGDARMALHLAIDAAPEAPAPRTDLDVTLTRSEVEAIGAFVDEEMSESDEEVVRLMTGGGHSGHGLYAACPDYPEEGAILVKQLPAPEAPAQSSAVDERAAFEAWVAKVQPTYWRAEAWQTEAWAMWQSISAALAQKGGK